MIVWDLGGVVARFDPAARLAALAGATGFTAAHVEAAIWGSGLDAAADRGDLPEEGTWTGVLRALDDRIDRDELRRCWAGAFVPDPAVLALVDGTPRPRALLTDNGPILEACLAQELQVVADLFGAVLLSWRLGATKADRAAFDRAAATLGRAPSELTLVDDSEQNVATARAAGWRAIRFESVDALRPLL